MSDTSIIVSLYDLDFNSCYSFYSNSVYERILFDIYFYMYYVKRSQVRSYLISFNAYFYNINVLEFFIK